MHVETRSALPFAYLWDERTATKLFRDRLSAYYKT